MSLLNATIAREFNRLADCNSVHGITQARAADITKIVLPYLRT